MRFVLTGGGEIGRPSFDADGRITGYYPEETASLDAEFVKMIGDKPKPNILFLPTASEGFDTKHFFAKYRQEMYTYEYTVRKYFGKMNAEVSVLYLVNDSPPQKEIIAKIEQADAYYVGAGHTKMMLDTWRLKGVDTLLKQQLRSGKPAAGVSAGAVCWFKKICTDSAAAGLDIIEGLGLIDGIGIPHCLTEPQRKSLARKLISGGQSGEFAICIDDWSALVIDGDRVRSLSSRPGAKAVMMYVKDGTTVEEEFK